MSGDECSREEQTGSDERSREEQTGSDERSREEQSGSDERSCNELGASAKPLLRVVFGLALAGVLVAVLWVSLAPAIQGVVALTRSGERVYGYIGDDANHLFTAAFVMLGLLSVLAVVAAAWVWTWQSRRGPLMVCAVAVGMLLAAGTATAVGAALGLWRYGAVDVAGAPISPEHRVHYVLQAPGVFFGHGVWQVATTIVVPAGLAALVLAISALSNQRDDLGTGFSGPIRTAVGVPADGR